MKYVFQAQSKDKSQNKGFAALITAIIVLSVSLLIALAFGTLALNEIKTTKNFTKSLKSYYLAEAGIEDILLRNNKGIELPAVNPSTLSFGEGTAIRDIGDIIAGTREIISQADVDDRIRKVRVVITISSVSVAFHYGAQVGDGGMEMQSNSRIKGNVFSNGDVVNLSGAFGANSNITDDIIVANKGKKIKWLWVEKDATVHTCKDCKIGGTLTFVSGTGTGVPGDDGTSTGCVAALATKTRPSQIDPLPLPISDAQISVWKTEAEVNVFDGNYTISGGETESLGPIKITGNLEIKNNATLIMTGTIYVIQDIIINNNAVMKLDAGYGSTSGVIIADGLIDVKNGGSIQGSGAGGSYAMLLSTNSSLDPANPAINVDNNSAGAVFYTSDGLICLRNNMKIREATGYKLYLGNNAEIEYEVGLQDASFSSGPSGSWKIAEWKEIE
ncbi:hypothetical protein KAT95_02835 [Candidatus Parcubacteria bacterium]|nr:hypothetical protein [Candidatus Parcubacteria bacterium]